MLSITHAACRSRYCNLSWRALKSKYGVSRPVKREWQGETLAGVVARSSLLAQQRRYQSRMRAGWVLKLYRQHITSGRNANRAISPGPDGRELLRDRRAVMDTASTQLNMTRGGMPTGSIGGRDAHTRARCPQMRRARVLHSGQGAYPDDTALWYSGSFAFSVGGGTVDTITIKVHQAMHRITNAELARRAQVNPVTVWRWQTGKPGVSAETAEKLQRALLAGVRDVPARNDAA